MTVAEHESGHAVAAYCLGRSIRKVEVWADHGEGLTRLTKLNRPVLGGHPDDVLDQAIVLLAGEEYLRSIGQEATGGGGDFAKASLLIRDTFESKAATRQGFDIVLEATAALVRSERFQTLAALLAPELERVKWNYGPDVEKFLRSHDPSTERHSVGPRVAFIRHPIGPSHNLDCVVCKAYPPSAADWAAGENRGQAQHTRPTLVGSTG